MNHKTVNTVLFRLEAGGNYGLGHLIRCQSLAYALKSLSIQCTFAMINAELSERLNDFTVCLIRDEPHFLALAHDYDCLIIDHYAYGSNDILALSKLNKFLVVMDDENNRGVLAADMIINSAYQSELCTYQTFSDQCKLLLGHQYLLLRPEFSHVDLLDYELRTHIVVTFGGSDVQQQTLPVLQSLLHSHLRAEKICVITGPSCVHIESIDALCQQHQWIHYHDVAQLAPVFSQAKLAITAAGSTLYELACCAVPMVVAVVADNQLPSAQQLSQLQWCAMVDCREQSSIEKIVAEAEKLYQHYLHKHNNKEDMRRLIDAQGAYRVAQEIVNTDHSDDPLDKLPAILKKNLEKNLCTCNEVSKIDIINAILAGATSLADVKKETYAAVGTGCCKQQIERLIECLCSNH